MAQRSIYSGSTSVLVNVYLTNATTNNGLSGLTHSTVGLTAYYYQNIAAVPVAIPLAVMTPGTWVSGGFAEVDPTHCPGLYSIGMPDAAWTTGQAVTLVIQGAANLREYELDLEITATNNQDANRGGLLDLPAAPMMFKKNQSLNAFPFAMFSNADGITPVAGLTITSMVSIDGAAFVPTANTPVSLSNGIYNIDLAAADTNGNTLMFMFSAAGATTAFLSVITQA